MGDQHTAMGAGENYTRGRM